LPRRCLRSLARQGFQTALLVLQRPSPDRVQTIRRQDGTAVLAEAASGLEHRVRLGADAGDAPLAYRVCEPLQAGAPRSLCCGGARLPTACRQAMASPAARAISTMS
jgi:hypothetical protein